MENDKNISNGGVFALLTNKFVDDCVDKLRKIRNRTKGGTEIKTESDTDMADATTRSPVPNSLSPKTPIQDRLQLREIVHQIREGMKVMVIMRGPPGCGKSYLAKEIIDATTRDEQHYNYIFSSDDFFYHQQSNNYQFLAHRLSEVHEKNAKRVDYYTRYGSSPIIVDNTNTKVWEMENYFTIAVKYGYLVHIVEPNTAWSQSLDTLVMKNLHGVPKEAIERMLSGYEPITVWSAMERFGLNYAMSMPQYRRLPPITADTWNDNVENESTTDEKQTEPLMLHKHRKNCQNENESFARIRQIYPSIALEILWDLFETCEGNGDWVMDILLNGETRISDQGNLDGVTDRARNDFECDCRNVASSHIEAEITTNGSNCERPIQISGGKGHKSQPRSLSRIFSIFVGMFTAIVTYLRSLIGPFTIPDGSSARNSERKFW